MDERECLCIFSSIVLCILVAEIELNLSLFASLLFVYHLRSAKKCLLIMFMKSGLRIYVGGNMSLDSQTERILHLLVRLDNSKRYARLLLQL